MNQVATNSLTSFFLASRPKTLGAIVCPVILGSSLAFAHGHFIPSLFITTLSCSVLLQILANFINDYGDFIKGGDTSQRLGPKRALQMGWISKEVMQKSIGILVLMILALGLVLVFRGGLPILFTGIFSLVLCFWYTVGPRPLSYLGFSEIAILIFFGPLPVTGSYYLQSLSVTPLLLVLSISPAFLSTALIMANNLRDIEEDKKNNKRTLAVRFGEKFSKASLIFFILGASLTPVLLVIFYHYAWWVLASCLCLIPALKPLVILREPVSVRYNVIFGGIGKTLYGLSFFLLLGIIYGAH